MTEAIRTFICLDLSQNLKTRLDKLASTLRNSPERVSWVKSSNIHLTLRFLGDLPSNRQAALQTAVENGARGVKSFELIAGGLGAFPNLRNPRVFWVGIKNADQHLLSLQKRIQQELEQSGFGKEDKPFSPHLTIGRARQGGARETAELIKTLDFADEPFAVKEVIVMRSDLHPSGAKYTPLAVIKLAE